MLSNLAFPLLIYLLAVQVSGSEQRLCTCLFLFLTGAGDRTSVSPSESDRQDILSIQQRGPRTAGLSVTLTAFLYIQDFLQGSGVLLQLPGSLHVSV